MHAAHQPSTQQTVTAHDITLLRNACAQEYSGEEHAVARAACERAIATLEQMVFGASRTGETES